MLHKNCTTDRTHKYFKMKVELFIHRSTYSSIFCHSAILSVCLTAVLPFYHTAVLPFRHSAILPLHHTAVLPYCHSAILPFCQSAILLYCNSAIVPLCHTVFLQIWTSETQICRSENLLNCRFAEVQICCSSSWYKNETILASNYLIGALPVTDT